MCDAPFIRCPACGNNSCNGGCGEDCKICLYVHGFEDGLPSDMHPEYEEDIERINKILLKK